MQIDLDACLIFEEIPDDTPQEIKDVLREYGVEYEGLTIIAGTYRLGGLTWGPEYEALRKLAKKVITEAVNHGTWGP